MLVRAGEIGDRGNKGDNFWVMRGSRLIGNSFKNIYTSYDGDKGPGGLSAQGVYELVDSLNISAKIVIPVGNSKSQKLNVINKISSNEVEQDLYDDVSFVPMLPGKSEDGLDS